MTYYLVCFNFDCNCIIELKNILRTLKRMMVYASSVLHFYKSAFVVKENEKMLVVIDPTKESHIALGRALITSPVSVFLC